MSMDHNIYLGHFVRIKGAKRREVCEFADKVDGRWVETPYEVMVIGDTVNMSDVARNDGEEIPVDMSEIKVTAEVCDRIIERFGRDNVEFNFGLVHEVA